MPPSGVGPASTTVPLEEPLPTPPLLVPLLPLDPLLLAVPPELLVVDPLVLPPLPEPLLAVPLLPEAPLPEPLLVAPPPPLASEVPHPTRKGEFPPIATAIAVAAPTAERHVTIGELPFDFVAELLSVQTSHLP